MTSPPIPPVFCLFLRADGISLVNRDLPLQFVENGEIFFGMKLWNSVWRGRRIQASSFISWLAITEGCWSRLSARHKAVHGAVHVEIIVAECFLQLLSVLNAPEVF